MKIPRILITAPASGSGKTAISCGLMSAFRERGMDVRACKCGPDYIDPMFHREVLGVDSRNLDLFFSDKEELTGGFIRHSSGADITVTEGVMGYYDGRGMDTDAGSSYDVARTLQIPVILVVPCRGAALSLAALVRGIIEFRSDSNIRGILLNRVSKMLYPRLKDMLEQELKKSGYDIPVVGYIPEDEAFRLESRHLGLVTPQELNNPKEQTERAGRILAESIDLDQIISVAQAAPELEPKETRSVHPADGYGLAENGLTENRLTENSLMGDGCSVRDGKDRKEGQKRLRIGIARDEAFCFYYKANLELLEEMGCELVSFSPLRDKELPGDISGLILGGGYPELYGERLSANSGLLEEIRRSLEAGMPCLAECGGFMYLHEELEDRDGNVYPMAGVIKGKTYPTGKLVRFGYVNITADKEADWLLPGETIKGHEFHYWDSTDAGTDCMAVKPDGKRKWNCIHMRENLFAGYPHLYLPSIPEFARRFVGRCREWERTLVQ